MLFNKKWKRERERDKEKKIQVEKFTVTNIYQINGIRKWNRLNWSGKKNFSLSEAKSV